MKLINENLTEEEFGNYVQNIMDNMESETVYTGQQDDYVPYYGELQRKHIYGDEKDEHEVVLYIQKYDEKNDKITYDIYEWDE